MYPLLKDAYDKEHRARLMCEGMYHRVLHLRAGRIDGEGEEHPGHPKMHYDERYTPYIRRTRLLPFINMVKDGVPKMNACLVTALVDRWRPETHTFHLPCGEMTITLQDVSMITALPISGDAICRNTDSTKWREQMSSYLGMEPGLAGRAAGATYGWIARNFGKCPAGCTEEVVQTHARAYVWVALCRTVFGDSSGSNVPFFWLELLADWDYQWSWGTAALAWLYRQVIWEPYGEAGNVGGMAAYPLNPACLREAHLWRMECPLICIYAVEMHLPKRVMRQFGLLQMTPVPYTDTGMDLHGMDKSKMKGFKNWPQKHDKYITEFRNLVDNLDYHHGRRSPQPQELPHNAAAYDAYLAWLGESTRLKLLSPAFDPEDVYAMADAGDTDMDEMKYFKSLREHCQRQELAPVATWVKTRKLAKGFTAALGCRKVDDVAPMTPSGSGSHHSSRGHGRHGEGSSRDVHMESSSRAQDEEDEGHQQEPQVEMDTSQMFGPATRTEFGRSPFELRERDRPRREEIFTPDAFAKGKNPAPSTQNVEQGGRTKMKMRP
ncbi:unnamed protein product [Alopecurus aequalis]